MHENKFEKQVQEKMEELQFVPSDAVWEKVDEEINKDKKDRRPLFWLFFFLGLLLLGGGYYFSLNKKSRVQEDKIQESKEQRNKPQSELAQENKTQAINEEQKKIQGNKEHIVKLREDELQADKRQDDKIQKAYPDQYSQQTKNILTGKKNKISSAVKPEKQELIAQEKPDLKKEKNMTAQQSSAEDDNDVIVIDNYKKSKNKVESGIKNKNHFDSSLNNKTIVIADNQTVIKDSVTDKKIAKSNEQTKKSSFWKIGFTGGAGISNINQSLFKSTYVTPAYSNAVTGPNGSFGYTSSQIKTGFSFAAGVFVNKYLSKRISFSAGINYHYYSTRINIGSSVDSPIYVYSPVTATVQVNGYYHNGNSRAYMNHYHFIELPLSMNFQLNKSPKTPLI